MALGGSAVLWGRRWFTRHAGFGAEPMRDDRRELQRTVLLSFLRLAA